MSDETPKSLQRIQELMTSLLRHKLSFSLADVEAALLRWRADELGVFEAHAEVLRHAARAERMADRMARVDADTANALLRDAYDANLMDRDEFSELVGCPPEDIKPSPSTADEVPEPALPEKRELVEELLGAGPVLVHVDARDETARVPERFRDDPKLVLRFGYGLTPAIIDLSVDDEAISGTLTFGGVPFRCILPWCAVYAAVSEVDQKGMVWPDDVPAPVVEQLAAQTRAPGAPVEMSADDDSSPQPMPPKPPRSKGGHLKLVK